MKRPFTNLGSNIDADAHRDQAVDREREANETKFHPCIESCTFRNGKGGEREAAEFDAPTPETDHHFKFSTSSVDDKEFCQRMERERDAARKERDPQCTLKQTLIGEVERLREAADIRETSDLEIEWIKQCRAILRGDPRLEKNGVGSISDEPHESQPDCAESPATPVPAGTPPPESILGEESRLKTERAEAMIKPILDMIDKILMPVKINKPKNEN